MKKKKDCKSEQVKMWSHLLQFLFIYYEILVKIGHSGVKVDLILPLFAYINHLDSYSMPYTQNFINLHFKKNLLFINVRDKMKRIKH